MRSVFLSVAGFFISPKAAPLEGIVEGFPRYIIPGVRVLFCVIGLIGILMQESATLRLPLPCRVAIDIVMIVVLLVPTFRIKLLMLIVPFVSRLLMIYCFRLGYKADASRGLFFITILGSGRIQYISLQKLT